MNKTQREEMKKIGYSFIRDGETVSIRTEGYLMVIEAHFQRNPKAPSFQVYASNWIAANRGEIEAKILRSLKPRFPKCSERMIRNGYSDWGSYGNPSYREL